MQRLAYTPKAYVFVKNSYGDIIDISRYVVSGSVNRRLDAVSGAQITLRNPRMIFTTPDENHRTSFTPMDPITIYLKRLRGRPVRTFTGFLDKTPYLQLYPGVIQLRASCTLKRLLYTFFDPALPYTQSFFIAYGWQPNGSGTWYSSDALNDWRRHADDDLATTQGKDTSVDGSISNLLFATLRYIGHWDPDDIFIEKLPADLFTRLTAMANEFKEDNEQAGKEFEELMRRMIGEGDFSGSGSSNGSVDISGINGDVPEQVYKVGRAMNVPYKHLLAAMETGLVEAPTGSGSFGNPKGGDLTGVPGSPASRQSAGWRQETAGAYPGVDRNNVPESAKRFFTECKQLDHGQSESDLAADVQRPAVEYRGRYADHHDEAVTLLRKIKAKVEADDSNASATPGQATDPSRTVRGSASGSDTPTSDSSASTKSIRDKIVEIATASLSTKTGFNRYSQAGATTDEILPAAPNRTDCSQWARAVYLKAGAPDPGTATGPMLATGKHTDSPKPGDLLCGPDHVEIFVGGGRTIGHGSPPIDYDTVAAVKGRGNAMRFITFDGLGDAYTGSASTDASGGGGDGANSGTGGGNNDTGAAVAGAFFATLQLPSFAEAVEAQALGGEKSLMNDKPLMPFIQQLTEACMRHFQSMPDGKFFAFYPDYFGEMNHRPPYWEIDDIEVLDGGVDLTDDSLVTHQYVVGDTYSPFGDSGQPLYLREIISSGVVTVFNAFMADDLLDRSNSKTAKNKAAQQGKGPAPITKDSPRGMDIILSRDEAVAFLQRYGARPHVEDMPMIKHPFFEMFLAYQRFLLAWAKQFSTTFSFTFMPELYPGGKVGFSDHGLQLYIEEVTHSFDYTSGFTTQAVLSAPSIYGDNIRNLPPNMVKAIIEPTAKNTKAVVPLGLGGRVNP